MRGCPEILLWQSFGVISAELVFDTFQDELEDPILSVEFVDPLLDEFSPRLLPPSPYPSRRGLVTHSMTS